MTVPDDARELLASESSAPGPEPVDEEAEMRVLAQFGAVLG
jgi:hypothetical protein